MDSSNIKLVNSQHKKSSSENPYFSPSSPNLIKTKIDPLLKPVKSLKKVKLISDSSTSSIKDMVKTESGIQLSEFDSYGKQIRSLMSGYRLESEPNLKVKFHNSIEESSKNLRSFFNSKNRSIMAKSFDGKQININVNTEEFKTPLDAVLVLKNNKIIHDNLIKTFLDRQTNKYYETYREIDHSIMNSKFVKNVKNKAKIFSSMSSHPQETSKLIISIVRI